MLEHKPVLLQETIEGLAIKPDGIYIDATFGRGGHSREILKKLGPKGRLMAMDRDPAALARANSRPFRDPRFCIMHASFSMIQKLVQNRGWSGKVCGILLDIGVSSPQLDDPSRGFSFTKEGPLDMRMNPEVGMDAATWINSTQQHEIAKVLREYGEERFANRIARAIVTEREIQSIKTTTQLANLIARVSPSQEQKHPATRTFQAIRIFINNELEELRSCLHQCLAILSVGGRLCAISFHSLEDRIVKQFIQKEAKGDTFPPELPIKASQLQQHLRKIGGLIRPSEKEILQNPRARSARLRIAEKIA